MRLSLNLLLLTVSILFAQKNDDVFIDGVAATVGDHLVLKSDVAQLVNMAAIQQRLNPAVDMDRLLSLQDEIVRSIIDQKIILEMAALDSIEVEDKEVDRALDQQIDMFVSQAGSEEKAEEMLGQSIKSFRREYWVEMRDRLITERYQQTLINKVSVSREDVNQFFNTYKDSLPNFPSTVRLRHILIPVTPGEESKNKAYDELVSIREKILDGEAFGTMASLYSQDPGSRASEGSLGYVRRGSLVPEFESVAFSQEVGVISEVVESAYGYHIIETQEKRGDKIKVRHILISPEKTEKDESLAYSLALTLKDSASSLEKYKDMALRHSFDQQTKEIGGDLGWVDPKNSPIPELAQVFTLLNQNECSLPVRSGHGYHLFWVDAFRPGGKPNLELHWTELENMALNRKRALWYSDWISLSRGRFYVHINEW